MCHKLYDKVHSAIASQVLEPRNGLNCVTWHQVWDLEAILLLLVSGGCASCISSFLPRI